MNNDNGKLKTALPLALRKSLSEDPVFNELAAAIVDHAMMFRSNDTPADVAENDEWYNMIYSRVHKLVTENVHQIIDVVVDNWEEVK
jgi:hypothetical protein